MYEQLSGLLGLEGFIVSSVAERGDEAGEGRRLRPFGHGLRRWCDLGLIPLDRLVVLQEAPQHEQPERGVALRTSHGDVEAKAATGRAEVLRLSGDTLVDRDPGAKEPVLQVGAHRIRAQRAAQTRKRSMQARAVERLEGHELRRPRTGRRHRRLRRRRCQRSTSVTGCASLP